MASTINLDYHRQKMADNQKYVALVIANGTKSSSPSIRNTRRSNPLNYSNPLPDNSSGSKIRMFDSVKDESGRANAMELVMMNQMKGLQGGMMKGGVLKDYRYARKILAQRANDVRNIQLAAQQLPPQFPELLELSDVESAQLRLGNAITNIQNAVNTGAFGGWIGGEVRDIGRTLVRLSPTLTENQITQLINAFKEIVVTIQQRNYKTKTGEASQIAKGIQEYFNKFIIPFLDEVMKAVNLLPAQKNKFIMAASQRLFGSDFLFSPEVAEMRTTETLREVKMPGEDASVAVKRNYLTTLAKRLAKGDLTIFKQYMTSVYGIDIEGKSVAFALSKANDKLRQSKDVVDGLLRGTMMFFEDMQTQGIQPTQQMRPSSQVPEVTAEISADVNLAESRKFLKKVVSSTFNNDNTDEMFLFYFIFNDITGLDVEFTSLESDAEDFSDLSTRDKKALYDDMIKKINSASKEDVIALVERIQRDFDFDIDEYSAEVASFAPSLSELMSRGTPTASTASTATSSVAPSTATSSTGYSTLFGSENSSSVVSSSSSSATPSTTTSSSSSSATPSTTMSSSGSTYTRDDLEYPMFFDEVVDGVVNINDYDADYDEGTISLDTAFGREYVFFYNELPNGDIELTDSNNNKYGVFDAEEMIVRPIYDV